MNISTALHHGEAPQKTYGEKELRRRKKRQQRRFIERYKVEFTVHGKTYRGLSSNFSLTGLFIRTKRTFQSEELLDIIIHLSNNVSSRLKGKVIRVSQNALWGTSKPYDENGMGIEIIEKDAVYLHFIRSLLTPGENELLAQSVFPGEGSIDQYINADLQNTCHLFDAVAFFIGQRSNRGSLSGKIWFEAKMKNTTHYTFKEPIIVFMTTKTTRHIQSEQAQSYPEAGTVMMSSSTDVSWKPDETILLTGKIDFSREKVLNYELAFIDYLMKTIELAQEEPITIDNYISTLWISSPETLR